MDRCRPTTSPIINNIEMFFIINKHGTPIIRFATIGPWAAAPFLGYAAVPDRAFSMIDFHGTIDDTIPYDLTPPFGVGSGPDGTVLSWDGYRYYDKPRVIRTWAEGLECGPAVSAPSFSPPLLISSSPHLLPQEPWPTAMDNVQDFVCLVHSGCRGGGEVVHCQGVYGHDYPFGPDRWLQSLEDQSVSWFSCSCLPGILVFKPSDWSEKGNSQPGSGKQETVNPGVPLSL